MSKKEVDKIIGETLFFIFLQTQLKTEIVAQLVRASVCGTEGRGFETPRSPPKQRPGCVAVGSLNFIRCL